MIIATRILKVRLADGDVEMPVHVLAPTQESERAWKCEFEIHFPDRVRRQAGRGVDSAQALIHCLYMIGAILYTSGPHNDGTLLWEKAGDGYGFPVTEPNRDLLEGGDAKFF